jgi:hypothetical protein
MLDPSDHPLIDAFGKQLSPSITFFTLVEQSQTGRVHKRVDMVKKCVDSI